MNIREAKEQIEHAVKLYLEKDEKGRYIIPTEKQRPVFLMGAPGIGKTAIMEQVAQELGVALVSYTMTHHTRQSALGLPYIVEKEYGGEKFQVSEYTMSEIIAAVYEVMEDTGICEGILFLDEINCVSETLAPAMLQFLQYKTFGQHKVPEGWIIVTAGNPPEYNHSVREFDIASWDRVKRMDVEPDYSVWKTYAYEQGMHPAILTYLDLKKDAFYSVKNTVDGKHFVTARGWEDLSQIMCLSEKKNLPVDLNLISQYVQDEQIARDFAIYYDLFKKYKNDYQVDRILFGIPSEQVRQRAMKASFDERISFLGLLMDGITDTVKETMEMQNALFVFGDCLKKIKADVEKGRDLVSCIEQQKECLMEQEKQKKRAGNLSRAQVWEDDRVLVYLEECRKKAGMRTPDERDFVILRDYFAQLTESFQEQTRKASGCLSNSFYFCEDVFEEGQEILILVTELTENEYTARFISQYGCREYFKHNKNLMFYERQKNLMDQIQNLGLDQV